MKTSVKNRIERDFFCWTSPLSTTWLTHSLLSQFSFSKTFRPTSNPAFHDKKTNSLVILCCFVWRVSSFFYHNLFYGCVFHPSQALTQTSERQRRHDARVQFDAQFPYMVKSVYFDFGFIGLEGDFINPARFQAVIQFIKEF